ncbi:SGNH/GDSL hydrolase family protein [Arthrobacter sp. LAR12-1-1.1]|uniref:SGNH/GDSL hydrolase family protein n=1 Tax=Arthrobacter sp. LAR12-1-1.1 TaxID=3135215 RepID=UPI0034332279
MGDSFTQGSGTAPGGAGVFETYAMRLAYLLGADETILAGIGGTGWLASASPFSTRMSGVTGMNPDVVIFLGSRNDSWTDIPALTAAVTSTVATCSAVPEVYVSGYIVAGTGTGNNAVKAGTEAAGRPYIDLMGIIYGTGKSVTMTGNGNADYCIGTDNVHPTHEGHKLLTRRLYQGIAGGFSMTP